MLRSVPVRGAWWVAFLFAIHPVHAESVAWITERKNVLSACFYLLSIFCYLQFEVSAKKRFYGAASLLFVCALFSKTVTVTLPVILLLLLYYQKGFVSRNDILRLLPFFCVAALMGSVTIWLETHQVGAVGSEYDLSLLQRCLIASKAILFYSQKILIPYPLMFNYPRWDLNTSHWLSLWPLLVIVFLAGGLAWLWLKKYQGIVLVILYYTITLFPALGFFNVYPFRYSFVADHFQYLASLGILVILVQSVYGGIAFADEQWLMAGGAGVAKRETYLLGLGWTMGVVIVFMLGSLTWKQSVVFENLETLWKGTLVHNPNSWLAHNNLGIVYLEQDKNDLALYSFDQAILSNPHSVESYTGRALAYLHLKKYDMALQDFSRAEQLNPGYLKIYINRGRVYMELMQYENAVRDFTKVRTVESYNLRGLAYFYLKQFQHAIDTFTQIIDWDPDSMKAYNDRGAVYLETKQYRLAIHDFTKAIEIAPDSINAYTNRGIAHVQLREYQKALDDFTRVLQHDPDAAEIYGQRGVVYWNGFQNKTRACLDWKQACQLGTCQYLQWAQKGAKC
ncbi:MAG: tetratricopeptide repeat protein [SAR324 cluster bacterium]|nr:tetratricopeptide repeat protein [SAR324 cluster bacterium]